MNFLQNVKNRVAQIIGQWGTGGYLRFIQPGATVDFEGELKYRAHINTVVGTGLDYFGANFVQSPPVVQERTTSEDGSGLVWKAKPGHKVEKLLMQPNLEYSWDTLGRCIALGWMMNGSIEILVVPDKIDRPLWLMWLPYDYVEARNDGPTQDGLKLVTYYRYSMPGGSVIDYFPERILRIRRGVDPNNMQRGWTPMIPAMREIFADNAASTFTSAVINNFGVPTVLFSHTGKAPLPNDTQAAKFASDMKANFSKENAGRSGYVPADLKGQVLSFSPKDLDLGPLSDRQVNRLCGAMGFDPMVLGLPSATKTYSNYEEANQAAYDRVILPAKASVSTQMTRWFQDRGMLTENERIWWDFSDVPAMQDDIDALWDRAAKGWNSGFIDLATVETMLGLTIKPDHVGLYKRDVAMGDPGESDSEQPDAQKRALLNVLKDAKVIEGKAWERLKNSK